MSEAAAAQAQRVDAPKANRLAAAGLERKSQFLDPAAAVVPFNDTSFGHDFTRVRAHTESASPGGGSPEDIGELDTGDDASQLEARSGGPESGSREAGLLVEDDAAELQPGQMRKSEFLDRLESTVRVTADGILRSEERSTDGCPYLDFWFRYYEGKSGAHLERVIQRYAPETAGAVTASEYIAMVSERVGQSVSQWARTGEVAGLPAGISPQIPGGDGPLNTLGRIALGWGGVFFKERAGGARQAKHPLAIRERLGKGRPLETGVRSRMEPVFGRDLSHVHTHTGADAAALASELNARAFTIGEHVSFGSGEYRPGTLAGDALIAHELAHVMQQGGPNQEMAQVESNGARDSALEADADAAAAGVVTSLWAGPSNALTKMAGGPWARLRSGLRLSRCSASCPTEISVAQLHPMNLTAGHVANGWRTGWGAIAEMKVGDAQGTNFSGAKIHENLNPGANSCTGVPNCQNTHGMGGGGGATFEVGSGLGPAEKFSCGPPFLVPSLVFPGKKNTFYDCHLAGFGSSKLHSLGLQTCRQDCQQHYDCNGSRIGTNNFTIERDFTRDVINGVDVTRIALTKT